jgi:ABC-type amino acid transport substrate-binding protein
LKIIKKDIDAMKFWLAVIMVMTLLVAGCSASDEPVANEQLQVVTESYPPYNFVNKDGQVTGQSTEIVKAVMEELGLESEIELLIFSEALELAQKGPGVVLFSVNRTPEREDLFKWVGPIGFYEQVFFARKDAGIELNDLDDAGQVKKLAVYENDAGAQYLKAQGFKNLDESSTDAEALKKLVDGEAQLWLGNREGFYIVAAQAGVDPDLLIEIPTVVIHANLFIAFSKDVEDSVVEAWQLALDRLKEERDADEKTLIEKIEAKYSDPAYVETLAN